MVHTLGRHPVVGAGFPMANGTVLDGSTVARPSPSRQMGLRPLGAAWARLGTMAGTSILIAVFVLALSPYAVSPVLFYPDEPQYIDAGVFMIQSGDWLMPANPNDAPNTDVKPIFTYWVIALSFKLFGTSLAAARLPYLLAGAAVIWLTYRLALLLADGARCAAGLACVVLLCNPLFWLGAIRCLPDIWLCLFLLLSAYGFIGLLTLDAPTWKHALLAYVGVGLAILAKGLPGLLFLGVAIIFGVCNPWRPRSWRRLLHVPAMALGTLVAISWFVIVFFTRGTEHLQLLWSDQVATRVQLKPWVVAYRFPLALAGLTLAHLPLFWPIWKMGSRRRHLLPAPGRERVACAFIMFWAVILVLAMTSTVNGSVRYLLPAFPLLAVLCGVVLAKVDGAILGHSFRRLLAGTLALLAVGVVLAFIVAVQVNLSVLEMAPGLALIAAAAWAAVIGFRGSWLRSAQTIALCLLLMMPASFTLMRKIARPDLEAHIEQRMRLEHHDAPLAGFVGEKGQATNLRLAFPSMKLMQWDTLPRAAADSHQIEATLPELLILPERSAALLPAMQYTMYPAGSVFDKPADDELLSALCQGRIGDCLLEHRLPYFIAVRIPDGP